jgi:Kdo2-lipid IVA lauroyltransferase/acyltransferase
MGTIGYYLFYAINWLLTLLPLWVLYLLSDLMYVLLYHLISYRKKVVVSNIANSFPEKTPEERKVIEKKFYRHLCDIMVESFKLSHISEAEHSRRMKIVNPELLNDFCDRNRDVIAIAGHYNNWEYTTILAVHTKLQLVTLYKPLSNKHFDSYMKKTRSKYTVIMTPMSNVLREIVSLRNRNIRTMYGFISDQTPPKNEIRYWTTFLNQDTPVFTGAERIAVKYDMPVVFLNIQKIKRGYYTMTIELLFDHTAGLTDQVITEAHVRRLEQLIREKPEFWLWSHRRWKHKKPAELKQTETVTEQQELQPVL